MGALVAPTPLISFLDVILDTFVCGLGVRLDPGCSLVRVLRVLMNVDTEICRLYDIAFGSLTLWKGFEELVYIFAYSFGEFFPGSRDTHDLDDMEVAIVCKEVYRM